MKSEDKFYEYKWLVETIRLAGKISFADINRRWVDNERSGGVALSRATFSRHKTAIRDVYGIEIECDRSSGYGYYIANEYDVRQNAMQSWMLAALSVGSITKDCVSLRDRILIESVPLGGQFIPLIVEAMRRSRRIRIEYRKYDGPEARTYVGEPYCLKMFKQRWYLLCHFHRDAHDDQPARDYHSLFALDRMLSVELTDERFRIDRKFDGADYFATCYGAFVSDELPPEKVVIRTFGRERLAIRDLPIHHSQTPVATGDNYIDYELFLRPTDDFCSYLVGRGDRVKVLRPQWLADRIRELHLTSASIYDA